MNVKIGDKAKRNMLRKLDHALAQVNKIKVGKIKIQPVEELLNEL